MTSADHLHKKRPLSNALILTTISTGILLTCSFLTNIIVGKLLSQTDFGVYNILMSLLLISVTLSLFGNNSSLIHFGGNPAINHPAILSRILKFTLALSLFISFLLFLFNRSVCSLLGLEDPVNLALIALAVPLFATNRILAGYFRSRDRIVFFSITESSKGLSFLLITTLFLLYKKELFSATSAIVLSELVTLAMGFFLLARCGLVSKPACKTPPLKEILKFSSHIALTTILIDLELRFGFFFIGNRAGHDKLAIFSVAFILAQLMLVLPGAIEKALSPKLSNAFFEGNSKKFEHLINRTTLGVLMLTSNIYIIILMNYQDILAVIFPAKPQLQEGAWMFAFLGMGFLFRGSFASVATAFTCIGRPEIYLKVIPLRLIINLVLTIVLWMCFGVIGVALGMAFSSVLTNIVQFVLLGRASKIKICFLEIYTCLFLASSFTALVWAFEMHINGQFILLLFYNSIITILFKKKLSLQAPPPSKTLSV